MGRKLDILLGRTSRQIARLKSYLGLAITRLAVLRGHRQVRCTQARGDVEQLLCLGHPERALIRAEQVIKEQNMLDVFVMIESYCNLITERAALIDNHKECPEELREAAVGLIYAAARCGDLPELQEVRRILASKFGKEFVSAAAELRSGCGINTKIVQKLSTKQPSLESRQMMIQEIAAEKGIRVQIYDASSEASDGYKDLDQTNKQAKGALRTSEIDLDGNFSVEAMQKYKDVETAAQAAFESAASAAAAARAAMELSRAESQGKGSDDRRKPGGGQTDETKKLMRDDGEHFDFEKKFEKISHVQNCSPEIEILPENGAYQGNNGGKKSSLKSKEQLQQEERNSARRRPMSVRTKRAP